ncbi:PepSY domain-containing protein [Donghicola sp. C2-DW-16]|uniref:PepSY domain-containing protein n=1 Tax=Donghicola mangrovi TaxID=2729614 RepID=A0A850QGK5_9RHOB|nr:PepSY domain-containing protein [Donghicola mangrovi]NVO27971.1 PepSY domain-containing protein [Donghicola mangrovi]
MKNTLTAIILASTVATAALASDVVLNDENTAKVRAVLTEQGYEVAKIKLEDGMYEAYAKKDGNKYEVFLNGDFEVVMTKED